MTGLNLGEKIKVRYVDDRTYTLDVEVIAIRSSGEFIGRVEAIFVPSDGHITGGETFDELMGKQKTFESRDILLRLTDQP